MAPVGEERRDQQLAARAPHGGGFATEDLGPVRFVPLVEGLPRQAAARPLG